jgi:hypothetical protein
MLRPAPSIGCGLLRGPTFREWKVGEPIELWLLSERWRCKSAHCQRANEHSGEEV